MHTVSLIGPMGSGKSEIGRVLAARLGWEFIDTDAQIEAREGRSIADIFRDAGEPHFRLVERSVVGDAVRRRDRVISTGGGAILSPITRQRLVRAGPVFYLRVPIDVLLERVGSDPDRPLLGADPRTSLERLVHEREALYAETGVAVEAARRVDAVVEEILGRLSGTVRRRVRVALGDRSYEVVVGAGVLPLVGFDLERLGVGSRLAIVTHRVLVRRFGTALTKALQAAGCAVDTITVPAGERAKSLRQASRVLDALSELGLTRSDTILALGGGVVGDLAGFVAGIYMRGVRLVHVPTTLLAQIDSSIGGKTAVNHPRAKNLIGVYHQPALVISDVETLASLPVRERRAGLAEVVKYGMVLDRELFEMVERDAAALSTGKARSVEDVVYRCAALKAGVVAEDEFDRGPREVLNYGHTVGHAIEAAMPGRLVHGEAVAVGMRVEARIAVRLGLLDAMAADRQDALLAGLGLPTIVPAGSIGALLGAMQLDKKRLDGRIRCSLPEGIGRARRGVDVPDALMEEVVIACQGSS